MSLTNRKQLLDDIRGLFKSQEIGDYTERELVIKLGYARETVRKYIEEVRLEVDPKDIQTTKLKFKTIFEEAINTCQELVVNAKSENRERDIRENIKLMIDLIKAETDFMERFFLKEKVADKFEIKEEKVSIQINMDLTDIKGVKELEARRV